MAHKEKIKKLKRKCGCADPDGDAHSPDAAYEPDRDPGYERAGGSAAWTVCRSRPMSWNIMMRWSGRPSSGSCPGADRFTMSITGCSDIADVAGRIAEAGPGGQCGLCPRADERAGSWKRSCMILSTGISMCWSLRRSLRRGWISPMPTP